MYHRDFRNRRVLTMLQPMLFCLLLAGAGAMASAQDYVGTYHAATPAGKAAPGPFQPRFEILPTRVLYTYGSIKPYRTNITYSTEGDFILARESDSGTTMYYPIYLYDRNTIYTMGQKLARVAHDKDDDGNSHLGTYEAVPPPAVLSDPQQKAIWDGFLLRIDILPAKVAYTHGSQEPVYCSIVPAKKGQILLARYDDPKQGVKYYPIYLLNKGTIFTEGLEFVRANDDKGIQEKEK